MPDLDGFVGLIIVNEDPFSCRERWKVLPDSHLELCIKRVMYMISDIDKLIIVAEGMMQDVGRILSPTAMQQEELGT